MALRGLGREAGGRGDDLLFQGLESLKKVNNSTHVSEMMSLEF